MTSMTSATTPPGLILPQITQARQSEAGFDLVPNLLLGLAWLGEASTRQLHRLWMPHRSQRRIQALLHDLRVAGLVQSRYWAIPRPDGKAGSKIPPVRQDAIWSLTRAARRLLKDHAQYPNRVMKRRSHRMLPHDIVTTETLVTIIELGMQTKRLSGVFIEHEVRLDPERSRPIMDAFLVLRTNGGWDRPTLIPWTKSPLDETERRQRFALENDRHTEPLTVIKEKAVSYQKAYTQGWIKDYGEFPIPMWIVPSVPRYQAIMRAWTEAWPLGRWLITTDAWLASDRWVEYRAGQVRQQRLFRKPGDGDAERTQDQDDPAQLASQTLEFS